MCLPLVAEGEFVLVIDHLDSIDKIPAAMRGFLVTDNVTNFLRADLAVLERDEAELRRYAPLALETAERDGHTLFQASAHRALGVMHGLAGEVEESETHLRQALQMFAELNTRWQLGRTYAEMAELAHDQAKDEKARGLYVKAIDAFEAMGAAPDLKRAQDAVSRID
jgi:tetratricopeptide (TPR) repeat protein